jgi:tetratricopeptide (TPR) repeat protein
MEENKSKLLTDHLDAQLQGGSLPEAEHLLRQDAAAREEWEYLKLAVEAIRHEGLTRQVAAVKEEYLAEKKKAPVVSLKRAWQAAAAILLLLGAMGAFRYFSVTGKGIYDDNYSVYEMPVSRGEAGSTEAELLPAYQQQNWKEVIRLCEKAPVKDNKILFLAGMAHLELKQYPEAIGKFEQVLENDRQSGGNYFHDEAEYYLAMALLAHNDNAKAIALLKKIRSTPGHLYAETVKRLSGLDLKILEYKAGSQGR